MFIGYTSIMEEHASLQTRVVNTYVVWRYNVDPEFREKYKEYQNTYIKTRRQNDPDFRERLRIKAQETAERRKNDPEYMERKRQYNRERYHRLKQKQNSEAMSLSNISAVQ